MARVFDGNPGDFKTELENSMMCLLAVAENIGDVREAKHKMEKATQGGRAIISINITIEDNGNYERTLRGMVAERREQLEKELAALDSVEV